MSDVTAAAAAAAAAGNTDAAAATAAANGGAPPVVEPLVIPSTNSYVSFTLLLFPLIIVAYAVGVDVLGFHLPSSYMSTLCTIANLGNSFVMIYTWIKLMQKLLIISTIQKLYFRLFSRQGFAACLKPSPFTGAHFKRWQTKCTLWLMAMDAF